MRRDFLRNKRNLLSKEIGVMLSKGQRNEAESAKAEVTVINEELMILENRINVLSEQIKNRMLVIPNIIDPTVPIGKDDTENV